MDPKPPITTTRGQYIMEYPILNQQTVRDQLSGDEENRHSWKAPSELPFRGPLLRVWNRNSGSRPEEDGRMIARDQNMCLGSSQSRRESLSIHVDHGNWSKGTPYISFTNSETRIEELIQKWSKKGRKDFMLTAINPNIRIRKGLPILDVTAEMNRYEIEDPYGREGEYYKDEYVCLWQVTTDEIIGHWEWNELKYDLDWYQKIYGAYIKHNTSEIDKEDGASIKSKAANSKEDDINELGKNFSLISIDETDSEVVENSALD
ncbi:uncharacterized protein F4822DRAFT_444383 [Hypoxylon trugodes]|uniref:uncharacterized protein n=1 Tax=Hypoxylon trugodes TaxID=326681 RepID=UPI0021951FA7|nr:uncharacterized protein F4822DRAFT_444383 [Hypoxylon trugodes]KAI1387843.1 hypothetical protein F4822DRAFT_444383 [Hypoxylon trugodes]